MNRTFEDKPAVRSQVPLLVGLVGPSGGGKTYSALRLATGIQRVSGGEIFYIDTEAKRALHYADRFKFRHIEFGAPFGSLDYLAAIDHCVKKGAGVVVVDSMSHEHEGPGGVLESHAAELDRMAGKDFRKRNAMTMLAWQKPKAERRRMINTILQLQTNFIFCFRAKEKVKIVKGEDPKQLGFMPIAGEEFVYEMTANCLLLPNAGGVPTWQSKEAGENMMIKLPAQFHQLFAKQRPLDEDTGEHMARWAAGDDVGQPQTNGRIDPAIDVEAHANACGTLDDLEALKAEAKRQWRSMNNAKRAATTEAIKAAQSRLEATPFDDDGVLDEPPPDWVPDELQ